MCLPRGDRQALTSSQGDLRVLQTKDRGSFQHVEELLGCAVHVPLLAGTCRNFFLDH